MQRKLQILTEPVKSENLVSTVWKVQDFSVTHILRKINFGESRSPKITFFAILEANFETLNVLKR